MAADSLVDTIGLLTIVVAVPSAAVLIWSGGRAAVVSWLYAVILLTATVASLIGIALSSSGVGVRTMTARVLGPLTVILVVWGLRDVVLALMAKRRLDRLRMLTLGALLVVALAGIVLLPRLSLDVPAW